MAKRSIKFLVSDVKAATVEAARNASVDIMNSLAQEGPAWTGRYSSAWYALAEGDSPGTNRSSGRIYKYNLRNVPKGRFKEGQMYTIVNGMSYADQAQDLAPFDPSDPIKQRPIKPVEFGKRPEGGRRGDLNPGKGNRRTAPLDWYLTYINGGALKRDLAEGAKRGFGTFKFKRRAPSQGFGQ